MIIRCGDPQQEQPKEADIRSCNKLQRLEYVKHSHIDFSPLCAEHFHCEENIESLFLKKRISNMYQYRLILKAKLVSVSEKKSGIVPCLAQGFALQVLGFEPNLPVTSTEPLSNSDVNQLSTTCKNTRDLKTNISEHCSNILKWVQKCKSTRI